VLKACRIDLPERGLCTFSVIVRWSHSSHNKFRGRSHRNSQFNEDILEHRILGPIKMPTVELNFPEFRKCIVGDSEGFRLERFTYINHSTYFIERRNMIRMKNRSAFTARIWRRRVLWESSERVTERP
jgi:hypothetical protein